MKLPEGLKSIKMKLFVTLTIVVAVIVFLLIFINNIVLEKYYIHSKVNTLVNVYNKVNSYYLKSNISNDFELELEKIAIRNNFDIIIKNEQNITVYSSDKGFGDNLGRIVSLPGASEQSETILNNDNIKVVTMQDTKTASQIVLLTGELNNGYNLYIRIQVASIQESVSISNRFLFVIGLVTIAVGGIVVSIISTKYANPILKMNDIAKKMSELDFSEKYEDNGSEDEINNLGISMNIVSNKLEKTIKELRETNIELEKDIEEKSKIDEMRKQFISDVSHELKTPIALIQGYAEGLTENVIQDEESKKYYAEVIQDEANKMDKLVKQLLELMNLEYGNRKFKNVKFNIVELIKEILRKTEVMRLNKNIQIIFDDKISIYVEADEFYIEQVITNYITNAIKNVEEKNGKKYIEIKINELKNKIRVSVINTGKNLVEEDLTRIWKRFYKVDTSRNREDGGSGIGLSIVKAIMNNYKNKYGVENRENGVEFYFELDKIKQDNEK